MLARAGEHGTSIDLIAEETETTEAIHSAAHPGRVHAEADAESAAAEAVAADAGAGESAS